MWGRLNTLRRFSLLQAPDISQFFIKRERARGWRMQEEERETAYKQCRHNEDINLGTIRRGSLFPVTVSAALLLIDMYVVHEEAYLFSTVPWKSIHRPWRFSYFVALQPVI